MNKFTMILITLVLAATLTACGDDDSSADVANNAASNNGNNVNNGNNGNNGNNASNNGADPNNASNNASNNGNNGNNGNNASNNNANDNNSTNNSTANNTNNDTDNNTANNNEPAEVCAPFAGCGGDLTGEWTFSDWCQDFGDDNPLAISCPESTVVQGITPTGTTSFNADGSYEVIASYDVWRMLTVPASCLTGVRCEDLADELDGEWTCAEDPGCVCTSLDVLDGSQSGTWSVENNVLTTFVEGDEPRELSFCVEGDGFRAQDVGNEGGAIFGFVRVE